MERETGEWWLWAWSRKSVRTVGSRVQGLLEGQGLAFNRSQTQICCNKREDRPSSDVKRHRCDSWAMRKFQHGFFFSLKNKTRLSEGIFRRVVTVHLYLCAVHVKLSPLALYPANPHSRVQTDDSLWSTPPSYVKPRRGLTSR